MKRRSGASQFQPPFHSVEILKPLWDQRLQGLSVVALKERPLPAQQHSQQQQ
jgi:hypothetical protein